VFLVNAQHTKNLPGRKTDVQECQWLLQLHTFGLLRNSFRPPEEILPTAYLLAAAGRARSVCQRVHPTDPKSVDGDERAVGQRH
jgi:hypothetical protein